MDYYLKGEEQQQIQKKFLTPSESSTRRQTLDSGKKEVSRNSQLFSKQRSSHSDYYKTNQSTQLSDKFNHSHYMQTVQSIPSSRKSIAQSQKSLPMSSIMREILDCLNKLVFLKGEFILEKFHIAIKRPLLAKLITESGLVHKPDLNLFDILMSKEFSSKPSIEQEDLEQVLVLIGKNFYSQNFEENPKSTIKEMFIQFLQPYVDMLLDQTKSPLSKMIMNWNDLEEINQSLIEKLEQLTQLFTFFQKQALSFKDEQNQKNLIFKHCILPMMKEFDICPYIIQAKDLFVLYSLLCRDKSQFNTQEFLLMLQNISKYYLNQLFDNENEALEFKIDILLKRIEISEGYEKFRKRMVMSRFKSPNSLFLTFDSKRYSKVSLKDDNLIDQSDQRAEMQQILTKYEDKLRLIFSHYASMGEPLNQTQMKSSRLVKMFKDMQLLDYEKTFSVTDLDLLIVKIVGYQKRINFDQFLKILKICALKFYSKQPQPLQYLIENKVMPFYQELQTELIKNIPFDISNIKQLQEQLEQESIREIMKLMKYCLESYFKLFSSKVKDNFMTFNDFKHFCSQFEIFPDIISISNLHALFTSLSFTNKTLNVIDFNGFIQALCLIGLQSFNHIFHDHSIEQKILMIVEKLAIMQPILDQKLRSTFKSNTDLQLDHSHKDIMRNFIDIFMQYFPMKQTSKNTISLRDIMNSNGINNDYQS